jgi:hypothetical protein
MASVQRRYPKDEFARRGDAVYEQVVRPRLTPADTGKFAAIDIDSDEFEIAETKLEASRKLRARRPAAQNWKVRIGSRYLHRL